MSDEPVTGRCVTCGGPIRQLDGPFWRHGGRVAGNNHPAQPDQDTQERAT